jgi:hypothetical protein
MALMLTPERAVNDWIFNDSARTRNRDFSSGRQTSVAPRTDRGAK